MQRARRLASCASPAEVLCEFVGEASKEPLTHHLLEAGSLPYTGCPQRGRGGACVEGGLQGLGRAAAPIAVGSSDTRSGGSCALNLPQCFLPVL